MNGVFLDRADAGRRLAARLTGYEREDPVVLGLPRGGIPVAAEIAQALNAPLDVMCVRKLGVPGHEELGMGAIAEGGSLFIDHSMVYRLGIPDAMVDAIVERKTEELNERVARFTRGARRPGLAGKTVILVDDGIATGGTTRAAARAVRAREPRRLVLAVPVAAAATLDNLREEVDEIVYLLAPEDLFAVGEWYSDFRQVDDDEVLEILERTRRGRAARAAPGSDAI